jgi:hypothetical protein
MPRALQSGLRKQCWNSDTCLSNGFLSIVIRITPDNIWLGDGASVATNVRLVDEKN